MSNHDEKIGISDFKPSSCYVCQNPIFGRYCKTKWGNVCETCFNPKLICFSCGQQLTEKGILRLADFRTTCPFCAASAIFHLDTNLISEVVFALQKLDIEIQKPTSYHLVDLIELKKESYSSSKVTELGFCKTIFRPKSSEAFEIIEHQISILFGLPYQMTQGALAHELFHAWIAENCFFPTLTLAEIEGSCEYIAYQLHLFLKHDSLWAFRIEEEKNNEIYGFGLRLWQDKPVPDCLNYLKNKAALSKL